MTGYFGYSFTVMSITTELGWRQYLMDRTVSSFRIVIGMEEEEEEEEEDWQHYYRQLKLL
jgi:hypothetical protein